MKCCYDEADDGVGDEGEDDREWLVLELGLRSRFVKGGNKDVIDLVLEFVPDDDFSLETALAKKESTRLAVEVFGRCKRDSAEVTGIDKSLDGLLGLLLLEVSSATAAVAAAVVVLVRLNKEAIVKAEGLDFLAGGLTDLVGDALELPGEEASMDLWPMSTDEDLGRPSGCSSSSELSAPDSSPTTSIKGSGRF